MMHLWRSAFNGICVKRRFFGDAGSNLLVAVVEIAVGHFYSGRTA